MTVQRTRELRELGDEELNDQLVETKSELFNLRFQHVTGQLDNYARLGDLRRDVARITTLLREREIAAAEAAPSNRAAGPAPSNRAAGAAPSSGATETAAPASEVTS